MQNLKSLYDYKYFSLSRNFQTDPFRMERMVDVILKSNPSTILDVGCGLGSVVNILRDRWKCAAYGIDFADVLKTIWIKPYFSIADAKDLPFANKSFDLVFSSDFFEHLKEEDIDSVLTEMKRVGNKTITFVAESLGKDLTEDQRKFHQTHKPMDWWKNKLIEVDVYSSHYQKTHDV
jgi:ubiquinone/menaquinone biosynthesis C-methylase UbiE